MRAKVWRAWMAGCVMLSLSACPEESGGDPIVMEDSGPAASACPDTTPPFAVGAVGLTSSNAEAGVKVRIDAADHVPPRFGTNSWTIAITDLNDQPLPQGQLVWACAFMPAHGHGSNPKVVEKLDATRWTLERQNMSMQGGWEIRLWVDADGGGKDFTGIQGGINSTACRGPMGAKPTVTLETCVPRRVDES